MIIHPVVSRHLSVVQLSRKIKHTWIGKRVRVNNKALLVVTAIISSLILSLVQQILNGHHLMMIKARAVIGCLSTHSLWLSYMELQVLSQL